MSQLSAHQQKVFDFICTFFVDNRLPPAYSDIAAHFGFSSDGTVRTYLEQLEKKGYIERLGKARGIRILKQGEGASHIPILGRITAGGLREAVQESMGTLADIQELTADEGRYALKVEGDSMKDAGILDGDLAIIQAGIPVYNAQIAAVMVEGAATLKRLYYEKERVRLQPENEFYEPVYIQRSDSDAKVLGRYIALVRRI